ncbi:MAG TPA: STAS domain-containing protein [Phycisphaerae bacterium]|nr:STAS domain-containing protein [Phycisphaerae bacterium]
MKFESQTHGLVTVLAPHGPLTHEEVPRFKQTAEQAVAQRSGRVVMDLRDVPYLDSAGIEALLSLFAPARSTGARPKLARLTDTCREALDLTDALVRLDVFDTVENAIRSYNR